MILNQIGDYFLFKYDIGRKGYVAYFASCVTLCSNQDLRITHIISFVALSLINFSLGDIQINN